MYISSLILRAFEALYTTARASAAGRKTPRESERENRLEGFYFSNSISKVVCVCALNDSLSTFFFFIPHGPQFYFSYAHFFLSYSVCVCVPYLGSLFFLKEKVKCTKLPLGDLFSIYNSF